MSKNTNLSFLTDYITADITNGRIGINNASPTVAFDVSGATRISGALTLTSTISNGTYTYTLPSATGTLALTSALSGTTNYVPKFTSSSAIGNSIIFDNGTNVGIGTTTPSAKLTVVGASANTYIAIDNAASGENYFAANAFHAFQTAGVERMRITSAGNVGIGTSSPSTFLHVVGPNTSNRGQLCIQSNDTNNAAAITFYYSTTKVGNIGSSSSDIGIESVNDTGFYTGGAERMRIPSTGGLLLGTTTSPTISGGSIIVLGDTIFCSGTFNVPSPYTQSLRIDIVWNNWGGNNVAAIVEVDIVAREWANLGGIAFGKVYALSSAGAATFNNTVNTTNITSANGSFSLSSPANYTLRLNFTPTNNKDIMGYLIKIPASTAGTGTNIASITASLV